MNLPREVEPAAVLLFKSFSYLGSYPACSPVPLSFDAFITAFVIFIGRLDTKDDVLFESLFFQSLSILPAPPSLAAGQEALSTVTEEQEEKEEIPITSIPPAEEEDTNKRISRGLSLAELGVDFNYNDDDLDFNTPTPTCSSSHHKSNSIIGEGGGGEEEPEILCRDLIELFVLLFYLGEAEQEKQHDYQQMRDIATSIISSLSQQEKEIPSISHYVFRQWQDKFSPHLFKPLQSLVIKSFAYHDLSGTSDVDKKKVEIILPQDKVPIVDTSDILSSIYTTLVSWTIPQEILVTKRWTRLYSTDKDGFSMNRFESHVFKYPGPTLLVLQVDAVSKNKRTSMILGAYITQPWRHSKQFWGTNSCFLFELDPSFDIYKQLSSARNDHYIYYHHDFGIGFGALNTQLPPSHHTSTSSSLSTTTDSATTATNKGFILYLKNTLQQGSYENETYPSNPTFVSCTKQRNFFYKFDTENIEVFGLGNEKDRLKQAKEWQFEKQEAIRRSGLNIRQADGQLDKELLKMAGIIDHDQRQHR